MTNKNKAIFLTGATGLLGSYLLKLFLEEGYNTFVLSRGIGNKHAQKRVTDSLVFWDSKFISKKHFQNLNVLQGDLTRKNLGLCKTDIDLLKNNIDEVFHCAAGTQFNAPIEELRKINVEGTKRILDFAHVISRKHFLNKINYISTAFVAGKYKGEYNESDFKLGQYFNNTYEKSKFEAEMLVRKSDICGARILIFRPSIIAGEYSTGKSIDFKMFYEAIRLLSLQIFDKIPMQLNSKLNLVPVDLAAKAIFVLSSNVSDCETFHIVAPENFLISEIVTLSSIFFHFKKPFIIDLRNFKKCKSLFWCNKLLETYIPYFNFSATFGSKKTIDCLKKFNFSYPSIDKNYLNRIFKFCAEKKFITYKHL